MKIGIMTMHRVQNLGSVLQAYALQYKIGQLGFESELIDYVFPPNKKKQFNPRSIASWCFDAVQGFPEKKRLSKIEAFRRDSFCCSKKSYDRESLLANPPQYDIYCTGSDQVWNPLHIGEDTSFMMDFAPIGAPRFAFASSFASNEINEPYFSLYSKYLSRYNVITVREESGIQLVKSMTGMDASVVCDPTLLLNDLEWNCVAEKSDINLKGGYILVYLLRYMFDPRPNFYTIIDSVRNSLRLPVFQINPYTEDRFQSNVKNIMGVGPSDFVKLFKNASFVITDSFHGTAFATIYNIPMIGVVKDEQRGDGRMATLRNSVDGINSIICYNDLFEMRREEIECFKCDEKRLGELRQNSSTVLERMIDNCMFHC